MLGTVDGNDLCYLGGIPGESLKEVFGVTAEEIETMCPEERRHARFGTGIHALCDYCEMIHPQGAKVLAEYTDGCYSGMPAVTINHYSSGRAVYQACRDDGSLKNGILSQLLSECGIPSNLDAGEGLPHGITAHSRTDGENRYVFVENDSNQEAPQVRLPERMRNMLSGEETDRCTLAPYGFAVFKSI